MCWTLALIGRPSVRAIVADLLVVIDVDEEREGRESENAQRVYGCSAQT